MRVDVGDIRIDDLAADQADIRSGVGNIGVKALRADVATLEASTGNIDAQAQIGESLESINNVGDSQITASASGSAGFSVVAKVNVGKLTGSFRGFTSFVSSTSTGNTDATLVPLEGASISTSCSVGKIVLHVSSFRGSFDTRTNIGSITLEGDGISVDKHKKPILGDKKTGRVGGEVPNPSSLSSLVDTGNIAVYFTS
nr:hypothetical protein HK105_004263 [Polyrhizophydium stewartii]